MTADLDQRAASDSPRSPRSSWFRYAAAAIVLAIVVLTGSASWLLATIRFPALVEITSPRIIILTSADGQDLRHAGELRLAPIAAKDMPTELFNAVLSIEDRRFYERGANDPLSMLRALSQNLAAGKIVRGGSTITQQLVKTSFLGRERTYQRKFREAVVSLWLERHLTKDQILSGYLNSVYLGSGATGFPAAAKLYFNKSVADSNLSEAAMLAGLISAPEDNDPLRHLDAARRRAATVLDAMVAKGKLTADQALVAKLHPATPNAANIAQASNGWFGDWVYDKALAATPPRAGTVEIKTTLDPRLQEKAAEIVKSTLAQSGVEKHASEAALVAMRPDGAVVAMVGGRNYANSSYNRAVQAKRQPGSSFKLFDYYAALRQGYSPDNQILDAPSTFMAGSRPITAPTPWLGYAGRGFRRFAQWCNGPPDAAGRHRSGDCRGARSWFATTGFGTRDARTTRPKPDFFSAAGRAGGAAVQYPGLRGVLSLVSCL